MSLNQRFQEMRDQQAARTRDARNQSYEEALRRFESSPAQQARGAVRDIAPLVMTESALGAIKATKWGKSVVGEADNITEAVHNTLGNGFRMARGQLQRRLMQHPDAGDRYDDDDEPERVDLDPVEATANSEVYGDGRFENAPPLRPSPYENENFALGFRDGQVHVDSRIRASGELPDDVQNPEEIYGADGVEVNGDRLGGHQAGQASRIDQYEQLRAQPAEAAPAAPEEETVDRVGARILAQRATDLDPEETPPAMSQSEELMRGYNVARGRVLNGLLDEPNPVSTNSQVTLDDLIKSELRPTRPPALDAPEDFPTARATARLGRRQAELDDVSSRLEDARGMEGVDLAKVPEPAELPADADIATRLRVGAQELTQGLGRMNQGITSTNPEVVSQLEGEQATARASVNRAQTALDLMNQRNATAAAQYQDSQVSQAYHDGLDLSNASPEERQARYDSYGTEEEGESFVRGINDGSQANTLDDHIGEVNHENGVRQLPDEPADEPELGPEPDLPAAPAAPAADDAAEGAGEGIAAVGDEAALDLAATGPETGGLGFIGAAAVALGSELASLFAPDHDAPHPQNPPPPRAPAPMPTSVGGLSQGI